MIAVATEVQVAAISAVGLLGSALIARPWTRKGMREMRHEVSQINRAVNHVPEGERTLIQRMSRVEAFVDRIAAMVGIKLPEDG